MNHERTAAKRPHRDARVDRNEEFAHVRFQTYGAPRPRAPNPKNPRGKQTATDAQGRQRFHGAFTGGFSAGYYNSVGSKDGWAPAQFRSSRQQKSGAAASRPEDFMDEEDFAEAAGAVITGTAASSPAALALWHLAGVFDASVGARIAASAGFPAPDRLLVAFLAQRRPARSGVGYQPRENPSGQADHRRQRLRMRADYGPRGGAAGTEDDHVLFDDGDDLGGPLWRQSGASARDDDRLEELTDDGSDSAGDDVHFVPQGTEEPRRHATNPQPVEPLWTNEKILVAPDWRFAPPTIPPDFEERRPAAPLPAEPLSKELHLSSELAAVVLQRNAVPRGYDHAKVERYRQFLAARAAGSKPVDAPENIEFTRAALMARPLDGVLATRFTSSDPIGASTASRVSSEASSALPARQVEAWVPHRLVCKRLGVAPPSDNPG